MDHGSRHNPDSRRERPAAKYRSGPFALEGTITPLRKWEIPSGKQPIEQSICWNRTRYVEVRPEGRIRRWDTRIADRVDRTLMQTVFSQSSKRPHSGGVLLLCLAIFYFGGLKFRFDEPTVYILDYGISLLLLAVLLRCLPVRQLVFGDGRLGLARTLGLGLAILIAMIGWDQAAWVASWLGESDLLRRWSGFPRLPWGGLRVFDLTVGLVLVAVTEEVVFRGVFAQVWAARRYSVLSLYLVSSLAFALLHLWQGTLPLLQAFGASLLLMLVYRRCGALWPPILVHYLFNLFVFTDGPCWIGLTRCP